MKLISDYTIDEMQEAVVALGQPAFRAKQLFKWVQLGVDFDQMSDLPQSFRDKLRAEYTAQSIKIIKTLKSVDGSEKYLYQLNDGNIIEGVYMPHNYGDTLCVSTQVGCRMGCGFCASTLDGLARQLSAGEILGQVICVNALKGGTLEKRKLSNIVLMGSGEPLDNYDNVAKFIKLATYEQGLNFSQRSISLSTCGMCDGIRRLADDGFSVTLSISLHATTDEARQSIMPIAKKYSLEELLQAAEYYFKKTGRRIVFEYSLIKESNMNFFDAKRLAEISKRFPCHINLIMLNYVKERNIKGCTKQEADRFLEKLTNLKISATIRKPTAPDISASCGQLRRKFVGCKED